MPMKRLFTMSALTSVVLVAGGLGLASCSDELNIEANGASQDAADILYDDLTCGWNLLIWNADTLQRCNIPLNTKLPVVVKSKNSNLSYEQVLDSKGRSVLCPHFTSVADKPDDLQSDRLHITVEGHPELGEKEVCLFIHPYIATDTRAAADLSKDDKILLRAEKAFKHGYNYGTGGAHMCANAIFDFGDQMSKYVDINDVIGVGGHYEEHTVDSIVQNRTQFSASANFAATLPTATGLISPSIGFNRTEDKNTIDNMHYLVGTQIERAAYITLFWNKLLSLDPNTNLPLYFRYLDQEFVDALNNPGSPQYQKYNPDKGVTEMQGIFKLLQDYGSFLPIQATLGGRSTFTVKRTEKMTEYSLASEVSIAAEWSKKKFGFQNLIDDANAAGYDGVKLFALTQLENARKSALSAKQKEEISSGLKFGTTESSKRSLINQDISFDYEGGKIGSSPTEWKLDTSNPAEWVIVDIKGDEENPVSTPIIGIETFFKDPNSERCQLVKKALEIKAYPKYPDEPMENNNVIYTNAFYHYRDSVNGMVNIEKRRMVLADVLMVAIDDLKKDWEPLEFEGPDKKVRTYYPLRANVFSPNAKDVNYVLRTDKQDYIDAFWLGTFGGKDTELDKQHCWYYALDYEDQCPGIVDIRFLKDDEYPEYYRNKKCAYSDDGTEAGYGADERYKVAMRLAPEGTPYEYKIKSFGLVAIEGPQGGNVFASSPMWNDLPRYPTESQKKAYQDAWFIEYIQMHLTLRQFYDFRFDIKQKTKFWLIWSCEPLTPIRSYKKKDPNATYTESFREALPDHR